jgi:serine/threonine protein phosphatase PrpC
MTMPGLQVSALTFVGRRENNEDAVLTLPLADDAWFLAVCDGMGGTEGGEFASRLVIDESQAYLREIFKGVVEVENLKEILRGLYENVQRKLHQEKKNHPEREGMGATMSCVLLKGSSYVVGNLGDSRVYHYSQDTLAQVTEDHTEINQFLKTSGKKPDEAFVKRYGHIINKSLDGGNDKPDLFPVTAAYASLREGEAFLLCTDGLLPSKVEDVTERLKSYLTGTLSLRETAEQLISYAFYKGSTDNISVVVASQGDVSRKQLDVKYYRYPPHRSFKEIFDQGKSSRLVRQWSIYVLVFIGLLGAAYLFYAHGLLTKKGSTDQQVGLQDEKIKGSDAASTSAKSRDETAKLVQWDPFANHVAESFRKSETLSWNEYPSESDVDSYTITIGGDSLSTRLTYCSLSQFRNLKPNNSYQVNITVVLRTGKELTCPKKEIRVVE